MGLPGYFFIPVIFFLFAVVTEPHTNVVLIIIANPGSLFIYLFFTVRFEMGQIFLHHKK